MSKGRARGRTVRSTVGLLTAAAVVLAACGSGNDDETAEGADSEVTAGQEQSIGSFVGEVQGSDAFVAVVLHEDSVEAYVCDGQTIRAYFDVPREGDDVSLQSEAGAALQGTSGR